MLYFCLTARKKRTIIKTCTIGDCTYRQTDHVHEAQYKGWHFSLWTYQFKSGSFCLTFEKLVCFHIILKKRYHYFSNRTGDFMNLLSLSVGSHWFNIRLSHIKNRHSKLYHEGHDITEIEWRLAGSDISNVTEWVKMTTYGIFLQLELQ